LTRPESDSTTSRAGFAGAAGAGAGTWSIGVFATGFEALVVDGVVRGLRAVDVDLDAAAGRRVAAGLVVAASSPVLELVDRVLFVAAPPTDGAFRAAVFGSDFAVSCEDFADEVAGLRARGARGVEGASGSESTIQPYQVPAFFPDEVSQNDNNLAVVV
jgi:hypothetical protein